MKMLVFFFLITALPDLIFGDEWMHPHLPKKLSKRSLDRTNEENSAAYWIMNGQKALKERLTNRPNETTVDALNNANSTVNIPGTGLDIAKNVILFLGDGMSIPTISATRVYIGGEEKQLSFEKFPYTALSKTYCTDQQVADSACSATAYLGGVKTNYGTIGVNGHVTRDDCPAMLNSTNHVKSLAYFAQSQGKMTGLVTTARVTHASPAGVYAHTAERDWESDSDVIESNYDPVTCRDIAAQLVDGETGRGLNVILGGGRSNFLPKTTSGGKRLDGVNLIEKWLKQKRDSGYNPKYIWNREQLLQIDNKTDYLMGLFNNDHINYNLKRDKNQEPSLQEMTKAAIKLMKQSPNGYFLFVEGARIDMGHHNAQARMALDETNEFSKAVQAAVDLTDQSDTLIVVTSDHAHTMSYSGYSGRGNDILGIAGDAADDSLPHTVLNYANGPGYKNSGNGIRYDVSNDDMSDAEYKYPGISPMHQETHGGDDVAVFARGPWAHLFTGVMEENVIPHLISYAGCLGDGATICDDMEKWRLSKLLIFVKKNSK